MAAAGQRQLPSQGAGERSFTSESGGQPPSGNPPAQASGAQAQPGQAQSTAQRPQRPQRRGMFGNDFGRQSLTSVEAIPARPTNQPAVLQLYGVIEALETVTITATSAADVNRINRLEGASVSAGESLVELTSTSTMESLLQSQSSLLELEAQIRTQQRTHENNLAALEIEQELLRITKNSVDRFSNLSGQQLSSSSDYEGALQSYQNQLLSLQNRQLSIAQHDDTMEQLQAQRNQLISQVRQAQQQVDDLSVIAPFDGRLAKVSVKQGQQVMNGAELVEIYNEDSLALVVRVPMRYRLDQFDAQELSATDSLGNRWQTTAIRPINESGAQRLTLIPAEGESVTTLPGTHVSLQLNYPVNDPLAVAIPSTAIYDQQRVYLFNQGTIEAADVDVLGRTDNGYLVRSERFAERTPIIITRLKNPVTGMAVSLAMPQRGPATQSSASEPSAQQSQPLLQTGQGSGS